MEIRMGLKQTSGHEEGKREVKMAISSQIQNSIHLQNQDSSVALSHPVALFLLSFCFHKPKFCCIAQFNIVV